MYTLSGVTAAAGVAAGPAKVLIKTTEIVQETDYPIFDPSAECARYAKKRNDFTARLYQISNPAKDQVRDLFGAAAGFIGDRENSARIETMINSGTPAPAAAKSILTGSLARFNTDDNDELSSEEMREINALLQEFIASLSLHNSSKIDLPKLEHDVVIIAREFTPAQLLALDTKKIKALVLEAGRTSGHLATVLRELKIPSVFGVLGATAIKNNSSVLVDANSGAIIVDPPQDSLNALLERQEHPEYDAVDESLINITIAASIGAARPDSLPPEVLSNGIGLLRSEFLFLNYEREPSENEMTSVFSSLFSVISKELPISARTFDFAEDKKPLFEIQNDERGPLKGYGACVGSSLLKKELKALLRSGAGRKIRIVFPLITRVSEARCLLKLLEESKKELEEAGIPSAEHEAALMIETPAAVLSARAFANECSMFIIGTSSLAEYASAPRAADISFTPALAKMIVMAARAANEAGTPIGIAGRYAARLELLPFFYKIGAVDIAVDSYQIQSLKKAVERANTDRSIQPGFDIKLYHEIMNLFTGKELAELITRLNVL